MTSSKPPDKTLVGMPSDLKAVLEKLDQQQAAAEKLAPTDDKGKARAANAERARTAPPPLPSQRPAAVPAPQLPMAAPAPNAGGAMDRTLIGMPAEDMQEALRRALAEVSPTPQAAPSRQRAATPAPAPAPQRPQPTAAAPVQAMRAQPVRAIGIGGSAQDAQPTGLGHSGVPYSGGLGYQHQDPQKMLAPQAPLDWPPARRSDPGPAPRPQGSSQPPAAAPQPAAASPMSTIAAPDASSPELSLGTQPGIDASAATEQASRLALPLKTLDGRQHRAPKKTSDAPPKRWPAISLILLAVIAFGGVIVLRAPHLLPASLSSLFAPTPAVPDELLVPEANNAPVLPSAAPPVLATDTSAATDPAKAVQTPTPTRPPAAPAMTSGPSAQLEKKAIEHLIANDYVNAKQVYEKLKSAEPGRGEFAVMVELLNRASGAGCGQPGQPACAGAKP